jgi:hypothetical protein
MIRHIREWEVLNESVDFQRAVKTRLEGSGYTVK